MKTVAFYTFWGRNTNLKCSGIGITCLLLAKENIKSITENRVTLCSVSEKKHC
jgi:hypothetical protein